MKPILRCNKFVQPLVSIGYAVTRDTICHEICEPIKIFLAHAKFRISRDTDRANSRDFSLVNWHQCIFPRTLSEFPNIKSIKPMMEK